MRVIEERIRNKQFVLIAEIGVNYYDIAVKEGLSPLDAAKRMIKEAAEAGIHGVKFQSYKADTLASKDSPYYWNIDEEPTRSQYELFRKYDSFGEEEYRKLAKYAEECKVEFLSTAFDLASADYLFPLMNIYKISSSDLNNLPFIEYQARKNKPIFLSVGASEKNEIETAVELIRQYNDKPLVLMHCVLEYPTPYEHANLNKIVSLTESFPGVIIGYSDHTKPDQCYDVIKTAYLLGARVIEKHFTLDKTIQGNDHYHAMNSMDAKKIIKGIAFVDKLRGNGELRCLETEETARRNARRSLVATKDIIKGETISLDMLTFKRPASGIPVDRIYDVVGRKICADVKKDEILKWFMFDIQG